MTEDAAEAIRIASFWKQGIPPVAGGYLDQTDSILDACAFIWADEARIEAEKSEQHGDPQARHHP